MTTKPGLHVERSTLAWRRTVLAWAAGFALALRLAITHASAVLCWALVCGAVMLVAGGLLARCPERRAAVLVVGASVAAAGIVVDAVAGLLG